MSLQRQPDASFIEAHGGGAAAFRSLSRTARHTWIWRRFESAVRAWRFRADTARTYAAMRELSDATLRDIGIERSEILSVSRFVAEHPHLDPRQVRR